MPFLWFDKEAEAAAKFYVSIFPHSKITSSSPMVVSFILDGQEFAALNGGPAHAHFNESISFVVACKDQGEIDRYWEKLTKGGGESKCGWLKDKYGLSWQVVPEGIGEMLKSPSAQKALLEMTKIEIDKLK
jgi:predicted 3-demethylubiquinone-9 3-methyltransferase (glyoxalase superfamily)